RRDREHRQRAAVVREALDVGDERAAALVEQGERAVDVVDVEHDRAHALGMLAQVAPGAPALADGLEDDEQRVARPERGGALPSLVLQLRAAGRHLDESEPVDEEAPGPVEIAHVVVQLFDALDADRRRRHDLNISAGLRAGEGRIDVPGTAKNTRKMGAGNDLDSTMRPGPPQTNRRRSMMNRTVHLVICSALGLAFASTGRAFAQDTPAEGTPPAGGEATTPAPAGPSAAASAPISATEATLHQGGISVDGDVVINLSKDAVGKTIQLLPHPSYRRRNE